MTPASRMLTAAALAAAVALCPDASGAQERGRIALTPAVDLLLPGAYYANEFEGEQSASKVRIRQKPLALIGAQLSYGLPGTTWRLGLGYARGESDLKVYHFAREGAPPTPGGPPTSSSARSSRCPRRSPRTKRAARPRYSGSSRSPLR